MIESSTAQRYTYTLVLNAARLRFHACNVVSSPDLLSRHLFICSSAAVGAMNSLHALPPQPEQQSDDGGSADSFVGYYVGGDSVAGAAKITVTKRGSGSAGSPLPVDEV
jgi:hypothetical protein